MITRACAFETSRLRVSEWHLAPLRPGKELAAVVAEMLTPAVLQPLPPAWHGAYTPDRARHWIAERDDEGTTLLVTDRRSGEPLGLVILFESEAESGTGVEVRLGYLLAEPTWGRGFASELVEGFVTWCRSQPAIRSIAGGVAADNITSARVLTKNGFEAVEDGKGTGTEQLYRLPLR